MFLTFWMLLPKYVQHFQKLSGYLMAFLFLILIRFYYFGQQSPINGPKFYHQSVQKIPNPHFLRQTLKFAFSQAQLHTNKIRKALMEKISTKQAELVCYSVELTKGGQQASNCENMASLSQYLQPLCPYQINCLVRQRKKDSSHAFCSQIRLNSNSHEPYCESKSPYSSKSDRTMAEQKEDDPSELIYRPNTKRRHQKSPTHLGKPLNRAVNDRNLLSIFNQEKKEPLRNAPCRLDRYIFTRPEIQLENPANITLHN